MTITLAAVYAPIGFLGGVTGILFREFAFTLASAVIVSGVVALTLSPMMSAALLSQSVLHSSFAQAITNGFSAVERWYECRLASSLDYRPATAIVALGVIASLYFLYTNSTKELAPQEDQGIILGAVKGPQYANLDYMQAYQKQLETALTVSDTDGTFLIYGRPAVNQGFVGSRLKPWNERPKTSPDNSSPSFRAGSLRCRECKLSHSRRHHCRVQSGASPCRWSCIRPTDTASSTISWSA